MSRTVECLWQGRVPLCPVDRVRLGDVVRYGQADTGVVYFVRVCPKCGRRVRCDRDLASLEPHAGHRQEGAEQLTLDFSQPAAAPVRRRRRVRRSVV